MYSWIHEVVVISPRHAQCVHGIYHIAARAASEERAIMDESLMGLGGGVSCCNVFVFIVFVLGGQCAKMEALLSP
jgi:hypothetical protein